MPSVLDAGAEEHSKRDVVPARARFAIILINIFGIYLLRSQSGFRGHSAGFKYSCQKQRSAVFFFRLILYILFSTILYANYKN